MIGLEAIRKIIVTMIELAITVTADVNLLRMIWRYTRQHRSTQDDWQHPAVLVTAMEGYGMRRRATGVVNGFATNNHLARMQLALSFLDKVVGFPCGAKIVDDPQACSPYMVY